MKEKDRLLKSISCEDAEDEQSVIPKWSSSELPMNGVGYNVIARLAHETGAIRLGDVEKPRRNACRQRRCVAHGESREVEKDQTIS